MSDPVPGQYGDDSTLVPLTLRVPKGVRAKLTIIAKLMGHSATYQGRLAIEDFVNQAGSNPELQKKADEARAEAQRRQEADERAIHDLFGEAAQVGTPNTNPVIAPESTPATNADTDATPEPATTPDTEPTPGQGSRSSGRRSRTSGS